MLGALPGASPVSDGPAATSDRALLTRTHSTRVKQALTMAARKPEAPQTTDTKTFAFWTLCALLSVLAIGNLLITLTVLAVLRLGRGMESIQFLPEHDAIQLLGRIELEHVYKRDGLIQSWSDAPLALTSENGSVSIDLHNRQGGDSRLSVGRAGVSVGGVRGVRVVSRAGEPVFSTDQRHLRLASGPATLAAQVVSSKRIASPTDEPLTIRSDSTIHFRGAEGTHLESKELLWSADQDVYLKSVNGSIVLSAKEGVYIDVRNIPVAIGRGAEEGQFKVCVCMPQGKLFRIAVQPGQRSSCEHVDISPRHNPCL